MRIDIFCESGKHFGLGHFYRCLKLASICVQNSLVRSIIFHNRGDFKVTSSLFAPLHTHTCSIEYKNYEWLSTQPEFIELAIVDSYEAEMWFYHRLSKHCNTLICLDDEFRDIYPPHSIILNPTAQALKYFSSHTHILWCGESYTIAYPTNLIPQPKDNQNNEKNIFISFGGVDQANFVQLFLDEIGKIDYPLFADYHFHIVLGQESTNKLSNKQLLLSFYHNLMPFDFLSLAARCNCAISTGGGTMFELLALRIPSIIIESASNQHYQISQWHERGAIFRVENMISALDSLKVWCNAKQTLEKPTHIPHINEIRSMLSTLQLGEELAPSLHQTINTIALPKKSLNLLSHEKTNTKIYSKSDIRAFDFNHLSPEQSQLILTMRNHPQVARWMYSDFISQSVHEEFIRKLASDKTKRYWLFAPYSQDNQAYTNESYLGVGSLTRINLAHKQAFLGIYTNPLNNQGHKGTKILNALEYQAFEILGLHTLHLEVLKTNTHAIAFYEHKGYRREGILTDFVRTDNGFVDVILMYKRRSYEESKKTCAK